MSRREQKKRKERWRAYQDGLLLYRRQITAAKLGISDRTAKYLMAYSRKISALKVTDVVREIDRTKLEMYLDLSNRENIRSVVEYCKDHPVRMLKREAKQLPLLNFLRQKRRHQGRRKK